MRWSLLVFLLLASSCNTQLASRAEMQQDLQQVALLEELRIALADVKQEQRSQALDIALLEEKLLKSGKPQEAFEMRLSFLEKSQTHLQSDLKALGRYAEETSSAIEKLEQELKSLALRAQEEGKRLDEVAHLRSTISSLAKSMSSGTKETAGKTHRVRSGDSLEKIARLYGCSVEELRSANPRLPSGPNPKILVGQELKIPADSCR